MRKLVIVILCAAFSTVLYAESQFPCYPVKVKIENKNIVLLGPEKSDLAQVYFFKNSSKEAVWLDHPTRKSASAGWSSYLRSENWSAFILNRKDFVITCSAIRPGKVDSLDCMQVLAVCAPKEAAFKTPPKGTYWLVEDKSWDEVVKSMEKRGISIK
jgi:hypothetical protein